MKDFINKIENKKEILFEILALTLIALFCFSITPKTLQNDTYYTVSIGNLILENGIDMKDHYSWHEDLPYTYPHWFYDLITALVYNLGGWDLIYAVTCALSILLGFVIYKVNTSLNKNQVVSFVLTIGVMYLIKGYITARAQLVTFILYMIVIFLIEEFLKNPKKLRL